MCKPNASLLPDDTGTPPWRRPGGGGALGFMAAFAAFDVILVLIVSLR